MALITSCVGKFKFHVWDDALVEEQNALVIDEFLQRGTKAEDHILSFARLPLVQVQTPSDLRLMAKQNDVELPDKRLHFATLRRLVGVDEVVRVCKASLPITHKALSKYDAVSQWKQSQKNTCNDWVADDFLSLGLTRRDRGMAVLIDYTELISAGIAQTKCGFSGKELVVVNNEHKVCSYIKIKALKQRDNRNIKDLNLYAGNFGDFIKGLPSGLRLFSLVYYDGCATLMGNSVTSPLKDLRELMRKRLLMKHALVAVTLCKRALKSQHIVEDLDYMLKVMHEEYDFSHRILHIREYQQMIQITLDITSFDSVRGQADIVRKKCSK